MSGSASVPISSSSCMNLITYYNLPNSWPKMVQFSIHTNICFCTLHIQCTFSALNVASFTDQSVHWFGKIPDLLIFKVDLTFFSKVEIFSGANKGIFLIRFRFLKSLYMLFPSNICSKFSFAPMTTLGVLHPLFYHRNTVIQVHLTAGSFVEAGEAAAFVDQAIT